MRFNSNVAIVPNHSCHTKKKKKIKRIPLSGFAFKIYYQIIFGGRTANRVNGKRNGNRVARDYNRTTSCAQSNWIIYSIIIFELVRLTDWWLWTVVHKVNNWRNHRIHVIFNSRLPCQFTQSVFISFGNFVLSISPSKSMILPPHAHAHVPSHHTTDGNRKEKAYKEQDKSATLSLSLYTKMNWLYQFNQFKVYSAGICFITSHTLHSVRMKAYVRDGAMQVVHTHSTQCSQCREFHFQLYNLFLVSPQQSWFRGPIDCVESLNMSIDR